MNDMLPNEVLEGLAQARRARQKRKSTLRVEIDGQWFRVLRLWADGFAVADTDAPRLRGLVDLHDGSRHVSQCLIVASTAADGEMRYEFKRATAVSDTAPLDFAPERPPPAGLLGRD